MNVNRLFRTVWRVNGVLLLAALLLMGGAALVAVAASVVSAFDDERDAAAPAVVEGDEELAFGDVEEIEGTPWVILPLATQRESRGYSSGESGVTRNLLFYDATSGQKRWLRPDHRDAIVRRELLRERGGEDGAVQWIRYEIADSDTDGDGAVTDEDAVRVAVSGAGGEGLTQVVRDADQILGYAPPRDGTLLVFFRRGDDSVVAAVDLAARKLRRTEVLPVR